MKRLKVTNMGDNVQGVRLEGTPSGGMGWGLFELLAE